jgi:hypothetical protein
MAAATIARTVEAMSAMSTVGTVSEPISWFAARIFISRMRAWLVEPVVHLVDEVGVVDRGGGNAKTGVVTSTTSFRSPPV